MTEDWYRTSDPRGGVAHKIGILKREAGWMIHIPGSMLVDSSKEDALIYLAQLDRQVRAAYTELYWREFG